MKNEWKKLLGYEPTREMKAMILADVRDSGVSLAEACAKMAIPPLYIDGRDEFDPDDYDNPFRPAIHITTEENKDKLNK